ncbi:uncharacterized protein METZ01_LOCUS151327 [marine metagenome]|jgi:hypothetical protein|uniref:MotA/TolQ/ExbB proton channel domain-containing protein n=1 Tax=marine metagenome TaxID=408172 RepID=A0A382AC09_9ZZZZ|tara:strand:+ start:269 stop:727 length:459 start_codon:yes stop_codon:yes gene_type:complete
MSSLLKWWLIVCVTALGLCTCFYFNIHKELYEADVTRLSFFILSIFVCTSVWIGAKTYKVGVQQDYDQKSDVGWFISESCLALGMVGTVTGFLIMLGTAFENVDVSNASTLQQALSDMALGMSTALWTTLVGLVCSLLIKVQLVNLEVALNE